MHTWFETQIVFPILSLPDTLIHVLPMSIAERYGKARSYHSYRQKSRLGRFVTLFLKGLVSDAVNNNYAMRVGL